MNVDAARCFIRFANVYSSPSGESLDEFHRNILQWGEVLGYQFEPRQDSNNDIEDDQIISSDEDESVVRLGILDW